MYLYRYLYKKREDKNERKINNIMYLKNGCSIFVMSINLHTGPRIKGALMCLVEDK